MHKQDYLMKLKQVFEEIMDRKITDEMISDGEELITKLSIDSLMGLQIIIKIEQVFDIIIEDDDLAITLVNSSSQLLQYIENYHSNQVH